MVDLDLFGTRSETILGILILTFNGCHQQYALLDKAINAILTEPTYQDAQRDIALRLALSISHGLGSTAIRGASSLSLYRQHRCAIPRTRAKPSLRHYAARNMNEEIHS